MGSVRDPSEAQNKGSSMLQTPKSHQRSSSSYSRNFSLLDIYGLDSPADEVDGLDLDNISSKDAPIRDNNTSDRGTPMTLDPGTPRGRYTRDGRRDKTDEIDEGVEYGNYEWKRDVDGADIEVTVTGTSPANGKSFSHHSTQSSHTYTSSKTLSQHSKSTNSSMSYVSPRITAIENTDELLSSPFDRYGFKKESSLYQTTAEEYNKWFGEYAQYSSRRKKKWMVAMKSSGLPDTDHPSRFPPKSDKVKKLVRRGIPGEWRGAAWWFYAGGNDKLNKHIGVYESIVRDTTGVHSKETDVIERDLHRTFPDNAYFNAALSQSSGEPAMIGSLRRVLTAFAHYQPLIGYCQSLNFLVGLLLLFMEEEKAFWMLVILTERIIPKVHSADLEGVHTDQGVLMLCIKEYIPQLWSILGKSFEGEALSDDKILAKLPPVTLVTSSWFMSLFVGVLPVETVLRVWDILWYEGSKTIFRISLTIAKMCLDSPELKAHGDMDQIELFQFMQSFPKVILDPNFLIDNCFKKIGGYGFGSLSQDEINKCREFVSKQRQRLARPGLVSGLTEDERRSLMDSEIHDVYGFHRSIMSGVVWNKNVSNKMKKKFPKKT